LTTETLTFLFTDIEGSTALLRRLGDSRYAEVLTGHHRIIRAGLAAHEGKEISTQGDGFFAVFSSPSACVAAVIEMQLAFAGHRWPAGEKVRVRMGIHSGEASETSTVGLVGFGVHRAARVAAVAHGGQAILSAAASSLVRDSLPAGVSLRDLGLHRLKDLSSPEQIFQLEAAGLEYDFPPLRSLEDAGLASNLPAQSASFIGRRFEVAEVRRLVESARLVTLTGAGGSGKTRLGLQVAAELLDWFSDGVWLVELAPVADHDRVGSTVSEALGVMSRSGRPVLETLLDALAPQHVLIVLDNCEHLIDACAKVADLILRRCPRVHLVTTSREPLGIGGETIYRVPSLSLPGTDSDDVFDAESSDAVALFMDRASAQALDFVLDEETIPLVVSICRRLDGMPLAIELAAARLRSISLASLHERLDQRFRLLTGGSRSALPRQQTLRATVDWSYSLLNGPEQSLLRRLSVFAEGFDLEAAEAVCGLGDIEAYDIDDLLGSLVDKSLVIAEPTAGSVRYRLLETIRQFSVERLVESDEREAAAVGAAHCTHFLSVAALAAPQLTGPEQGRWLRRLDADQANLERATEYAGAQRDGTARVLQFAVALRRYWWTRFRTEEAVGLVLRVLERPDAQTEPELLSGASATVAGLVGRIDIHTAQRAGERAVTIARQLANERLLTEALGLSCAVFYFAGDAAKGFPLGKEAVEHARRVSDDVLLGQMLVLYLLCSQGIDPASTGQLFAEAIACTDRSGDQYVISLLHNNAGVHALEAGKISDARSHLEQAALAERGIGAINYQVTINLGWVMREEGDANGAGDLFQDALRKGRRSGDRSGLAYANLGLACISGDLGYWHRGAVLHGVAETFRALTGVPWQSPEARYRQISIDGARAHLGDDVFAHAYAEGREVRFEDAVDLGFRRVDSA